MNINSGEPPPPGFEDDISRVAEIESVLKSYKGNALIGLEYTIEIQENRGEPGYHCVLCDKRGDPRTIVQHWTSFQHRLKYLEKHFPTTMKELDTIRNKLEKMKIQVQKLSEAIERHHGRSQLFVATGDEYRRLKMKIFEDVKKKFHYDERNGPNFINAIDRSLLQSALYQKKESEAVLDEISSDSDGIQGTPKKAKKREQSPAYRIMSKAKNATPPPPPSAKIEEVTNSSNNQKLPTPMELSLQASHIAQEKYKWEKYRCMLEIYLKQTENLQKQYEKNPEKHPLYPDEWKAFWNRRYKELQREKKVDPNKYDYKPEWALFWSKRRQELYSKDIEKKKRELKEKLELPENAEETQFDKLKERYKVQAAADRNSSCEPAGSSRKLENTVQGGNSPRGRHDNKVINISDEDSPPKRSSIKRSPPRRRRSNSRSRSDTRFRSNRRSRSRTPPRYERKRTRLRSRSRSMSPFSDDYEFESRNQYERGLIAHRRTHLPPIASSSRRYATPPSTGADPYYDMSHLSSYKHSHYVGHFRNGKETFPPHPKYDRISMSPPPLPKVKPSKPEPEPELDEDGSLTVVAVLRLLTALEENLGSLGPKMIDLLGKALALENVKANSSEELLMNDDTCVFFETAKEKLKGLLIAEVIEDPQKVRAVKKAIRNIAAIVHQVQTKGKLIEKKDMVTTNSSSATSSSHNDVKQNKQITTTKDLPFDRQLIASKLAAALVMQGREDLSTSDVDKLIYFFILMVKISKQRQDHEETPLHIRDIAKEIGLAVATPPPKVSLSFAPSTSSKLNVPAVANFVEEIFENEALGAENSNDTPDKNSKAAESNNSLESLTDSDLQTLLQNFKHLSTEEQHHLIFHLKKLEMSDPLRVEKLRKFVNLNDVAEKSGTSASANTNSTQRVRNDASASSTTSNREPSLSKHYEDDSPRGSLNRSRSHFSDDEDNDSQQRQRGNGAVNPNKFSLDDEDDDDYNFEDVIKVASSNVDKRAERADRSASVENVARPNAPIEPPAPGTLKSSGDALTFNRAAMNINLNDTQNLIANLMGNLNQNNTAKKSAAHEAQSAPPQTVTSILTQKQPTQPSQQSMPTASMPFHQQQQQQQQQQQYLQQQYPQHYQQQQQQPQQQQFGSNNAFNPMGYMHNNQRGYYNAAYNNRNYPQGYAPPQIQQQWPGNQQPPPQPPQPPQPPHGMGYNMYGGN